MENIKENINLKELEGTSGGNNNQNGTRKSPGGFTETTTMRCPKCGSTKYVLKAGTSMLEMHMECQDCGEKYIVTASK